MLKLFRLHILRILTLDGAIALGLLLMGCAGSDPWGQRRMVSDGSSREYRPEKDILAPAREAMEGSAAAAKVGKEPLDLAECMVVALENNPRTHSAWRAARAAAAEVGGEKADYLPQADFTSGVTRSDRADITSSTSSQTGPTTTYDAAFGVRYLLFDGGRRAAGVSGAKARLHAANFRHNASLQKIALEVEEAYHKLLAARWKVKVEEESLHQRQRHVELARARKEAGVVSRADVLKAETELADARLQLVRAKSQVRVARGELASVMNLEVSAPLRVEDVPEKTRQREMAAVEKLLTEAAGQRPELQAALADVQKNQSALKAARAGYWPKLSASADYGWRDEHFAPNEEEWSVGLGLSLPLFTGFERSYRIRRREEELRKAVSDYEDALRGVALEVWTAYARVQEADEAIEAAQALVASAEESLEVARGEYRAGTGTIIELIDAETAHTAARNQLVQARLDWYVALARLERAVGRSIAGDR
ncbi:MAG: TolC family protein [Candidatus Brocadiia bacterium]